MPRPKTEPYFEEVDKCSQSEDNMQLLYQFNLRFSGPKPKVYMFKGSELLPVKSKKYTHAVRLSESDPGVYTIDFFINSPVPEDSGVYHCKVKTEVKRPKKTFIININGFDQATYLEGPTILDHGDSSLTMYSRVHCAKVTNVLWTKMAKNGKQKQLPLNDPRFTFSAVEIMHQEVEISLRISSLTTHDAGDYNCEVVHEKGREQLRFHLDRTRDQRRPRPAAEGKIRFCTDMTVQVICFVFSQTEVIFKWILPGGMPAEFPNDRMTYQQESRVNDDGDCIHMSMLKLNHNQTLSNGRYICVATNEFGSLGTPYEILLKNKKNRKDKDLIVE